MDRAFLDANVLVCAAYYHDAGLCGLWKLSNTVPVTSTFAIEEAQRNLLQPDQKARLIRLIAKTEVFTDYLLAEAEGSLPKTTAQRLKSGDYVVVAGVAGRALPRGMWLPEKDRPIYFAAKDSESTHLLTLDEDDFGALLWQKVRRRPHSACFGVSPFQKGMKLSPRTGRLGRSLPRAGSRQEG